LTTTALIWTAAHMSVVSKSIVEVFVLRHISLMLNGSVVPVFPTSSLINNTDVEQCICKFLLVNSRPRIPRHFLNVSSSLCLRPPPDHVTSIIHNVTCPRLTHVPPKKERRDVVGRQARRQSSQLNSSTICLVQSPDVVDVHRYYSEQFRTTKLFEQIFTNLSHSNHGSDQTMRR